MKIIFVNLENITFMKLEPIKKEDEEKGKLKNASPLRYLFLALAVDWLKIRGICSLLANHSE